MSPKWSKIYQKWSPKSKNHEYFTKKIGKRDFPEKRTHYGGLTMFSGVPMVQKSLKIAENGEKTLQRVKKHAKKTHAKKTRKKDVFH